MMKYFIFFTFLSLQTQANECSWCVSTKPEIIREIQELATKEPAAQLKSLRDKGLCINILDSDRKVPKKGFFIWADIEKPTGSLTDVTKLKNLMGKTLCQGEHKMSKKCPTIVLASDAPQSSLLHEYLHYKQILGDKTWCPLSEKLWKRTPTAEEEKIIRDREWDVHKALFENRKELKFNTEDEVTVISETLEEAQARQSYDKGAIDYVKKNKLSEELMKSIEIYKERMGIPKEAQ